MQKETKHTQADINKMVDLVKKGISTEQIRRFTGIPCNEQAAIFENWRINNVKK